MFARLRDRLESLACALHVHDWQTVGTERGDYRVPRLGQPDLWVEDHEGRVQECQHCGARRHVL